uniref:uncharacterized protein LOC122603601 n=1 Tax=Erigeron canadensis TaxID=72917 RepID=UPI001CB9D200|nr:uncharacterized protein LOC122603601 [Erigeron canadensis]
MAPIPGSAIVKPELGDNFIVKGNHMKMIQENQFDGKFLSDPYKHIADFEEICEMFKYGRDMVEPVKLRFFPLSLTGEAKLWFNGLEKGSIDSSDEMKRVFANRFFPPDLQQKTLFSRNTHLMGLFELEDNDKNENSQILLDAAGGGKFLYKSANDAYQVMEDKVMMRMSKTKVEEGKSKAVSFMEAKEECSRMEAKFDTMMNLFTNKFDSLEKEMNNLKYGYSHGGASWGQNRNQGNFTNGFNSHSNIFPTRYPRNNQDIQNQPNQNFLNHQQRPHNEVPIQPTQKSNEETTLTSLEATIKNFTNFQKTTNQELFRRLDILRANHEQGLRNHQASITYLEKKLDRISETSTYRPTGSLPSNTQPNPRPSSSNSNSNQTYKPPPARTEHVNAIFTRAGNIYQTNIESEAPTDSPKLVSEPVEDDFTDDESVAEEIEMEPKPTEKRPIVSTEPVKPPLKAYKPKIPYPQRLRKEKMVARYGKFLEMIKAIRINMPLVDVLAGMPNYAKFIKELLNNKDKLEEVSATFLNEECTVILQNQIPPKLDDPGSFIITCSFGNILTCDALADLGASINLMPYSLYAKLSLGALKPTGMSIRLADRSFQYPLGIAENMLIEVGRFIFPVDFVIREMDEDSKVPLILGRPFLYTADAIIRVKDKELTLGVGDDRMAFNIDKAMKHSYSTDDTCFRVDVIDENVNDCT